MASKAVVHTTKEQEADLVRVIQTRNEPEATEAWLQLFELLHPLLYAIALKYVNSGKSYEELVEIGKRGMKKALDHYNPDKEYKFSAYSTWWIRAEIHKALGLPVE